LGRECFSVVSAQRAAADAQEPFALAKLNYKLPMAATGCTTILQRYCRLSHKSDPRGEIAPRRGAKG